MRSLLSTVFPTNVERITIRRYCREAIETPGEYYKKRLDNGSVSCVKEKPISETGFLLSKITTPVQERLYESTSIHRVGYL